MGQNEWDKMHERIKAANYEIRESASQARRAEIKVDEARGRYAEAERHLMETISKATGVDQWDLYLGSWKCTESPTGMCLYDQKSDPCCDQCLVCGDPDERK